MLARSSGEFDAIEQQRPAIDQADVAQVQIAVAEPHLAGPAPLVEQRPDPRQFGGEAVFDAADLRRVETGGTLSRRQPILVFTSPAITAAPPATGRFSALP